MKRAVIDTNVLISWYKHGLSLNDHDLSMINPVFSVITQIESVGYWKISSQEKGFMEAILETGTIIPLEGQVLKYTIRLRQQTKIKTPDAIIAATALAQDCELWTANIDDFKQVEGLKIFNPL